MRSSFDIDAINAFSGRASRMKPRISIKRVYGPASPADGKRILAERLWPRGLTKEKANVDLWLKEVAPSTALRKSFHGDEMTWPEFRRRYIEEVRNNPAPFDQLVTESEAGPIVLLYGSRETEQNHAIILRELVRARLDETSDCTDCLW